MKVPDLLNLIYFRFHCILSCLTLIFHIFFSKMTQQSTRTTRCYNRRRASMKQSLAESKYTCKIMMRIKLALIKTVHLIPRTRGQRGLRHTEWRTPRFGPKGAQEKKSEGECFAPRAGIPIETEHP